MSGSAANNRDSAPLPHVPSSLHDGPRRPVSRENEEGSDTASFARHQQQQQRPTTSSTTASVSQGQLPQRGTASTVSSVAAHNGPAMPPSALGNNADNLTQVEGTGCTYIIHDEIGRGAYGRVYLTDVVYTPAMPAVPSPPGPQLPALRPSSQGGGGNALASAAGTASNGTRLQLNGNIANACMVLKRMENASVEDGLQAATLREVMVLEEVSGNSSMRERGEIDAFNAGRAVFKPNPAASTITRSHDSSAFSLLDNSCNTNTISAEERWDEEGSSSTALRHDDYDVMMSKLRRRIQQGRHHLIGIRDTIMRPREQLAYVAMEYCEGGDVWHFLRNMKLSLSSSGKRFGDVMPRKLFRRWAVELILALAFLHSRNISHRDLKPQNLMLAKRATAPPRGTEAATASATAPRAAQSAAKPQNEESAEEGDALHDDEVPDGEQYSLKVGDFGLSRLEEIAYKKYVHEAVTLWYRSPDVLLGNTNYTYSADAWSLGCILVEMASGSVLFKGRDETDELRHIFTRGCRPSLTNFPRMKEYPYCEKYAEILHKYRDTDGEATAMKEGTSPDMLLRTHVEKLIRHLKAFLKERNAQELFGATGIDLIARLLVFDPERRLTVLQAVSHPFVMDAYAEVHGSE